MTRKLRGSLRAAGLLAALIAASPSVARAQQAVDRAELAFWQAVDSAGRPAEYQAYLDTYPHGLFAPLARQRLATAAPPLAPSGQPQVSLRPVRNTVRLTDGITLDLNAEPLQRDSNLRLAVVPATTPDAITDAASLVADSTLIPAARLHITIPAGPPGQDEVRLYAIPPFAADYVIAARAAVTVSPGTPGAVLTRDLAREVAQLGPVRFEANHRDRPIQIQAAFLRVRPRNEWNIQWFATMAGALPRQLVLLSIGQPNVAPDANGSTGEAICVLSADNPAVLNRVASLQVGDPVTLTGIPTSWNNAGPADPVLIDRCALR